MSSPCLRVSVVNRARRRGQTLVIALAILFLLVLLGGVFISMVARNLQRVQRQGGTDDSLTLALAGLQHAAHQFKTSEEGADWRPRPSELLWKTPVPPNLPAQDLDGDGAINGNDDIDGDGTAGTAGDMRQLDPDALWLDPARNGGIPYVRVSTGRGRFLVRVTFMPEFRYSSATTQNLPTPIKDEFDPNSGLIHVESIGRPGEFDGNDPTFFTQDPTQEARGNPIGPFRKVEAYVPIGLLSQLWWITNVTNERGPATLGVGSFRDTRQPNGGAYVEYPAVFEGGILSNVSVEFVGRNTVKLYPARGERIQVKGNITMAERSNAPSQGQPGFQPTNLRVLVYDDDTDPNLASDPNMGGYPVVNPPNNGRRLGPPRMTQPVDIQEDDKTNDRLIGVVDEGASGDKTPNFPFNPIPMVTLGGADRFLVADERHTRADPTVAATATNFEAQSTRLQSPPVLDQIDPATGVSRWLELTRDSGATIQVQDANGNTRLINTGWYQMTDAFVNLSDPANAVKARQLEGLRARGLYIDNFGDIQYASDRAAVKDEWLQRGPSDVRRRGWLGDYYIPTVVEDGTTHPICEVLLTRGLRDPSQPPNNLTNPIVPKIRVTRFDLDRRQLNFGTGQGRLRQFYTLANPPTNSPPVYDIVPAGQTREFEYPQNGVVYFEGSVRVRGVVGAPYIANGASPPDPALVASERATRPRGLTLVSGGTIYIEGNLTKEGSTSAGTGMWQLGLLAHDFVTLNPTAFTRLQPGDNVVVEADTFDDKGNPAGYHFTVPQGDTMGFATSSADPLSNLMLLVKHTGVMESAGSNTSFNLSLPNPSATQWPQWPGDLANFSAMFPPVPPPGGTYAAGGNQLFYLFAPFPVGPVPTTVDYARSNYQTVSGSAGNFERKAFYLSGGALPAGMEATFRLDVGPQGPVTSLSPEGQPYWLSKLAVLKQPARNGGAGQADPVQIRIEAAMYAYQGSWFIIPPPYFNDNPLDTIQNFVSTGLRAAGTFPVNLPDYPFYHEPLNYQLEVRGAISENYPAEPNEKAAWTERIWTDPTLYDLSAANGLQANQRRTAFAPDIVYRYDANFRRLCRGRIVATGEEFMIYTGPPVTQNQQPPTGTITVQKLEADAKALNSYFELLPLLPRLPAGALVYEGNPL